MNVSSVRVAIVDDHAVVRHGLETFLRDKTDYFVAGSFDSSRKLLAALPTLDVSLVLMDYALGDDSIDGFNFVRALRMRYPRMRIIVVSAHLNAVTQDLSLRAGANGFFSKSSDITALPLAIRTVMRGGRYPAIRAAVAAEQLFDTQADLATGVAPKGVGALTAREIEVLRCCLDGLSVSQIARKFSRSSKTISGQKRSGYRKLSIENDHELYGLKRFL